MSNLPSLEVNKFFFSRMEANHLLSTLVCFQKHGIDLQVVIYLSHHVLTAVCALYSGVPHLAGRYSATSQIDFSHPMWWVPIFTENGNNGTGTRIYEDKNICNISLQITKRCTTYFLQIAKSYIIYKIYKTS